MTERDIHKSVLCQYAWYADLQGAGTNVPEDVLKILMGMPDDAAALLVRGALAQSARRDIAAILLAATSGFAHVQGEVTHNRSSMQSTPISCAVSSSELSEGQDPCKAPTLLLSAHEKRWQKLRAIDPQIEMAMNEISEMAAWGDALEASLESVSYAFTTKSVPLHSQKFLPSPRVRVMGIGDALCLRRGLPQRPTNPRTISCGGATLTSSGADHNARHAVADVVQGRCWEYLESRHPILAQRRAQSCTNSGLQSIPAGLEDGSRSSSACYEKFADDLTRHDALLCRGSRGDTASGCAPMRESAQFPRSSAALARVGGSRSTDAQRARELISARFAKYLSPSVE